MKPIALQVISKDNKRNDVYPLISWRFAPLNRNTFLAIGRSNECKIKIRINSAYFE